MKVLVKILLVLGMMNLFVAKEALAAETLQEQINATPEGDTLQLREGTYHESVILNQPIVLMGGKGTIIKACSAKPAVTITGKNVSLKRIKVVSCKKGSNTSAIYMSGKNHRLEDIRIESGKLAIKVENADHSTFRNIKISGQSSENGLDLWYSPDNTFEGIQMDHVQDGFYMENSPNNTFTGNTIRNSRYGFHVMFSDNITIKKNNSARNFAGAMIMGTHHSIIEENELIDNNQNVNALGLLLYDVHQSTIDHNRISHNRVGMFMEDSSGNKINSNEFIANFVGAQLNKINNNVIEDNTFISNVNEVQANEGTHNKLQKNYWDAALKLDTDGDGKSNLPYQADPYFLNLAKDTPPYQLFFQHPGLILLQKMLKSPASLLVTDEAPLMKNELIQDSQTESHKVVPWFMSISMIFGSLFIIYFGRKKG